MLGTPWGSRRKAAKQNEGALYPDCDGQFLHIAERSGEFLAVGDPVVGTDCEDRRSSSPNGVQVAAWFK